MCFQEGTWLSEGFVVTVGGLEGSLGHNEYVTTVLMDLTKAFDCLPHKILLSKLSAYGLSDEVVIVLKIFVRSKATN